MARRWAKRNGVLLGPVDVSIAEDSRDFIRNRQTLFIEAPVRAALTPALTDPSVDVGKRGE